MKVAIIHYWLVNYRGGEKVLETIAQMYPQADIYTLFYNKKITDRYFPNQKIFVSRLNKLPFSRKYYRHLLPLMPYALENFDLTGYDLVISSESGPAKGVIVPPNCLHICYCHTPMRYIWDMKGFYINNVGFLSSIFLKVTSHYMRMWDYLSAQRVDGFIANSSFIQKRIKKYYNKDSVIIHPPINTQLFHNKESNGQFLIVSELVGYKKIDLAIEAFNELGLPLNIVGDGPERSNLKRKAKKNITFMGKLSQPAIIELYATCSAFIMCANEDFGMVMVEALASGKPVIAYGQGGSLDIVTPSTGILFEQQDKNSLIDAIKKFQMKKFSPKDCQKQAEKFDIKNFKNAMNNYIKSLS